MCGYDDLDSPRREYEKVLMVRVKFAGGAQALYRNVTKIHWNYRRKRKGIPWLGRHSGHVTFEVDSRDVVAIPIADIREFEAYFT